MSSSFSNQEVIDAYKRTGSVWRAGKELGLAGQTVHERLRALNYPLATRSWTPAEDAELRLLVGTCAIGEIARRLGRPYNGVALRISRKGLTGNVGPRKKKIPRGAGFDKVTVLRHMKNLEGFQGKITQYCRSRGLDVETLARAIQKVDQSWWNAYVASHSKLAEKHCAYCESPFYPTTAKQTFCSRECSADSRRDSAYFGGNRRNTIGLAEKVCQLCARKVEKGLSAHHIIGKENDPDNTLLIALCAGCHQMVGQLAGRTFVDEEVGWKSLINLVMFRRKGLTQGVALEVEVDMKWLSQEQVDEETADNDIPEFTRIEMERRTSKFRESHNVAV